MAISYKKPWESLIDKGMKKELCAKASINPASAAKMGYNGYVTTGVLQKICMSLACKVEDIMEIVSDDK